MGRKIPGKKHRTVKDPYKQNQKRLESIKSKINNPPANIDEQEIPKSLLEIMKLKKTVSQKIKKKPVRKKIRKQLLSTADFLDKDPIPMGATKPETFIPNIVQKPNESHKSFLDRVSLMTQSLINEIEFEKKFGVEIKKNPETGEVLEVKNLNKKKTKSKKKKLIEKRKEKLSRQKDKLKNEKDFSQLKDNVKFGEVVHRPPDLTAIKKQKNLCQNHKYSTLLLKTAFKESCTKQVNVPNDFRKEKAENERKFIVEAYRQLKKYKRD